MPRIRLSTFINVIEKSTLSWIHVGCRLTSIYIKQISRTGVNISVMLLWPYVIDNKCENRHGLIEWISVVHVILSASWFGYMFALVRLILSHDQTYPFQKSTQRTNFQSISYFAYSFMKLTLIYANVVKYFSLWHNFILNVPASSAQKLLPGKVPARINISKNVKYPQIHFL